MTRVSLQAAQGNQETSRPEMEFLSCLLATITIRLSDLGDIRSRMEGMLRPMAESRR